MISIRALGEAITSTIMEAGKTIVNLMHKFSTRILFWIAVGLFIGLIANLLGGYITKVIDAIKRDSTHAMFKVLAVTAAAIIVVAVTMLVLPASKSMLPKLEQEVQNLNESLDKQDKE